MENFTFKNPTTIYFGRKMEERVGEIVSQYSKNILLHHYGEDVLKLIGVYDPVIKSLRDAGVEYTELGGVVANPRLSLIKKGIEICRSKGIDFVLNIGGGSVIDSGKAIAFGALYSGDVWDLFLKKAPCEKTLPTGSILTLPGTGSESSNSCVVTNEETGQKESVDVDVIRPQFAILNPELTMSLPPYQTACGTYDAFSHIMERYFTDVPHVVTTDFQCEAAMRAILTIGPLQLEEPDNYDYRAEIMWACKIAHDNSLGVGRQVDWASHVLGHRISAVCDLAHGASLAILFPAWMKHVYKDHLDRFCKFAVNVFDVHPTAMSRERTALEGIARLEAWTRKMGLPVTLSEANIDASLIPQMTKKWEGGGHGGRFHRLAKKDIDAIFESAK
ncbi:MAG: iron-containing alcohol dehydrogenase [Spirochaetales bacterium]|nr:iron-containing alcohol dehydrogenase [Spirochaetales bacterium]